MNDADVQVLAQAEQLLKVHPAFRDERRLAVVARALRAEKERLQDTPTVFAWIGREQYLVNGELVHQRGVGLPLAYMVIGHHQQRLGPVRVDGFFRGRRAVASATQALERAATAIEQHGPDMARLIRAIGTTGGVFVFRNKVEHQVQLSAPVIGIRVKTA
jgi:hypothetical protein